MYHIALNCFLFDVLHLHYALLHLIYLKIRSFKRDGATDLEIFENIFLLIFDEQSSDC